MSSGEGSPNPFEAPGAPVEQSAPARLPLASRNSRAYAVSVDGLLYMVAAAPIVFAAMNTGEDAALLFGGLAGLAIFGIFVYQTYLVATTGQTIGKRMLEVRIVRKNGASVDFVHAVLLRSWVMGFATGIPLIGGFVSLLDILLIFSEDRRCLHDHLADTIVVEASATLGRSGPTDEIPSNPWER